MKFPEKKNGESNREYALNVIKINIINLEIKPGSMLGEQEIADLLGLSRTPVHEALLELSKSKIVDILPQKGSKVAMIDPLLVEEAAFMRTTIESAIIEVVCKTATEEDIRILEENIQLQEFYLTNHNFEKILELDNDFHRYMYKISNKMQCCYMVQLMNIHFDRIRNMSLHSVKDIKIIDDHKEILEAIKKRDNILAKELLRKHLSRFEFDEQEIREHYPEYYVSQ